MKKKRENLFSAKVSEEARQRIFKSADQLFDEMALSQRPAAFPLSAKVGDEARQRIFKSADRLLDEMHEQAHGRLVSSPVPAETRQRVFSAADRLLDELHGEKPVSFLERLWSPLGGLSLAGVGAAAAMIIALTVNHKAPSAPSSVAMEPELIRNVDMLLELDTLEHWNPGSEKNGKGHS